MRKIRCLIRRVLNYILFLLLFNSLSSFALVNLFGKLHLYELNVERPDEIRSYGSHLKQSFVYYVNGSGHCAAKSKNEQYVTNHDPTKDDSVKVEANVLIYSNYEQTLSFLLEITFNSPILIGKSNLEGFDLLFELEDKRTACIQIIPDTKELIGNFQSVYRLRIKDPAFLSHNSKLFTFYFGQVTLRALVACNAQTSQLCISNNIFSRTIQVGIRSAYPSISTSTISADDCEKHLMNSKTCILKYPQPNGLSYYIVMHPMSKYFQVLKEDLDVSSLTQEQQELYDKAKNDKANEVQLADKTFKMSTFESGSYSMLYHFKSKTNQKLANGMVFKIVEYATKDIMYMGIFDEPSAENFCAKLAEKCPNKNKTCVDCYDMDKPHLALEFVAMKAEDKRSSCKDPIFKAYDFESVKLVKNFQSQSLSTEKKILSSGKTASVKKKFAMNTDYLPRICMNIDNSDGIFNVKLIFNDYQQTGQTSLFGGTTYTLKLYSFSFNQKPNNLNDVDKYFPITIKQILSIPNILPNRLITIRNLDQGHYFLEVYISQKSSICSVENECVEESVLNNEFQCVPCRKLVVQFLLEYNMLTSSEMSNSNTNNQYIKFNKFKRKFWSESVKYQVENIHFQKEKNPVYECTKDSNAFAMDLERSMEIHYENLLEENINSSLNESLSEPAEVSRVKSEETNKNRLISAVVPSEYKIEWSYLPYRKAFFVEDTEPLVFSVFFMLFYVFVGAFLIFFILFVYWLLQTKKDIFDFEKKIVFYLSIDVNQETQGQLKKVVCKYAQVLKKSFKKTKIDTIDFKTSSDERFVLIKNADWIVYVCCTPSEIKKLSEPMKFGHNSFQDDYNRIHFGELICKKCINITFNRTVNCSSPFATRSNLNENEPHELKNLLPTEQNPVFNSVINSSRASCHLLLPEENNVFIKLLTQYDYNTADIYTTKKLLNINKADKGKNGVWRRGLKKFLCDLCFRCLNFQLKRVLANEYKRNKSLFEQIEIDKREEMLMSDDENCLFRDESSDSQSLFKYSSDNYTSQILRTNSSSSSHE